MVEVPECTRCGGFKPALIHGAGMVAGLSTFFSGLIGVMDASNFEGYIINIYCLLGGLCIFGLEIRYPDFFHIRFGFYGTMIGRGMFYLLVGTLGLGSTSLQKFLGALCLIVAFGYILAALMIMGKCLQEDNPYFVALPGPLWTGNIPDMPWGSGKKKKS